MIIGTNLYLHNLLSICILDFAVGSENGVMCAMKEIPLSSYGDVQPSAKILEKVSVTALVFTMLIVL